MNAHSVEAVEEDIVLLAGAIGRLTNEEKSALFRTLARQTQALETEQVTQKNEMVGHKLCAIRTIYLTLADSYSLLTDTPLGRVSTWLHATPNVR